jgi:hypothetical protein
MLRYLILHFPVTKLLYAVVIGLLSAVTGDDPCASYYNYDSSYNFKKNDAVLYSLD